MALSDRQLEAHALIVGASGAGKTTTLETILAQQIARGRPVVAIDMKGSPGFESELAAAATAAGRRLTVWRPDGQTHWNPLAHGGPTALKDRLMSAERFSEPHYQRAAERYLQTALTALEAAHPDRPPSLSEVVTVMAPPRLASLARHAPQPLAIRTADYLASMTPDQLSAAAGLGTRLALLSESVAGPRLEPAGVGGRRRERRSRRGARRRRRGPVLTELIHVRQARGAARGARDPGPDQRGRPPAGTTRSRRTGAGDDRAR